MSNFIDLTDPVISFLVQSGRTINAPLLTLLSLVELLAKLVDWYNFGILLKVPPHVLRKIEADYPVISERRKTELYDYWLKNEDNPTWYKVCGALMKMPKREEEVLKDVLDKVFPLVSSLSYRYTHPFPPPPPKLTITHQSNVARSLTEIQINFAKLVSDIQIALEKFPFVEIKRFISGFLHTTLKFNQKPQDVDELFDQLKPHYCFMNYGVLEVVVQQFVKESMEVHIKEYTSLLEEWLQSTTVIEFKAAVENQLEQVTQLGDPLCPVVPVVLKLEVTVNNLWKLLKYIFRDKSSVLTHIRIERGSVIVRLLAPQSELLPLLSLASKKRMEMIFLGIESVHIGTIMLKPPLHFCHTPFNFNNGFHEAFKYSDHQLSIVQFLLELGINPNTQDGSGFSPLMLASMYGNIDDVITLLQHNTDVNIKAKDKKSALHYAASHGYPEIAQLLLKAGANPNDQDITDITPISVASYVGHKAIVELLIKNKADVNLTNNEGVSALMVACKSKSITIVQLLLKAGANPNLQIYVNGLTALHLACASGVVESVQSLLQFKADPNIQDRKIGFTPIMVAIGLRYHKIVELLVKSGASIDIKGSEGITALILATNHDPAIIATLLNGKVNVNIQDTQCRTALFVASLNGDKETVKQLLMYQADPNLCAEDGTSPLHIARSHDVAELLLNAGAYPNALAGSDAVTPLHPACLTGDVRIIQVLLYNGADPNVLTISGMTPLCAAAVKGYIEIADALLKAGTKVDLQRTKNDWTPLFFAAVGGHFKIVKILLKYGASLKENKHGITPQVAAFLAGQYDISRHLFEVAASTGQLSLPSPPPFVSAESTSIATGQSSVESQTTSSDGSTSQIPLVNEEENTSNHPSTQPSEETVFSYFNKVHSMLSSSMVWMQNSYDNVTKRFENYLETLVKVQTHI